MDNDIRPKEILQSSFDLLGELSKFNYEAFRCFEQVLDTEQKVEHFLRITNRNLVDSNMFIRSLMLSYHFFMNVQTEHAGKCHVLATIFCCCEKLKILFLTKQRIVSWCFSTEYLNPFIFCPCTCFDADLIFASEYAQTGNALLKHISDFVQQLTYMKTMIETLKVNTLTQVR